MPVSFSSRESLQRLAEDLAPLQWKIWYTIRHWEHAIIGPCTREIAEKLHIEIGTVCGRIDELLAAGAIAEGELKLSSTGRRVKSYIACEWRAPDPHQPEQMGLL
jgi:DNA-binding MarR family transcriptional regulator